MSAIEQLDSPKKSLQAYLKEEAQSDYKHEFWDGQVVAMAGGTPAHNKIANSVGTAIDIALDKAGKDCAVYSSDQQVYIPAYNRCVYPDCTVLCGAEELDEKNKTMLLNPLLLIEVLSESTKQYDSTDKFEAYRSIPSFKEYVLVWQTLPKVQSWYKEEDQLWRISSAFGLDKSLPLYSLGIELSLAAVYKRVESLGQRETPNAW
ncbi:MAG TPA: Uma2 family endonuclease [Phaeodactylibacter sp.]|nr:Uma2 family endonuclease [Phaeodactylibacter sp.]